MARNLMRREGGLVPFGERFEPFEMMRNMLRWDPLRWDPFRDLERTLRGLETEGFTPSFDVKETKDAYEIYADLPGCREEDVDVSLSGNMVTISGKREKEEKREGEHWYALERDYGSFTRTFTLPEGVDEEKCEATFENGVLKVHLHKLEEEQAKRIHLLGKGKERAKDVDTKKGDGGKARGAQA